VCNCSSFEFNEVLAGDAGREVVDEELWDVAIYVDATNHKDFGTLLASRLVNNGTINEGHYVRLRPNFIPDRRTLMVSWKTLRDNRDVAFLWPISSGRLKQIKIAVRNHALYRRLEVVVDPAIRVVRSHV